MKNSHGFIALVLALAVAAISFGSPAFATQPTTASGSKDTSEIGQAVSDTWITTKVKTELATTLGIDSTTKISVDTRHGVVALTGVLADKQDVKKAVAAAKSVKGVKAVDDSGLKVK